MAIACYERPGQSRIDLMRLIDQCGSDQKSGAEEGTEKRLQDGSKPKFPKLFTSWDDHLVDAGWLLQNRYFFPAGIWCDDDVDVL